MSVIPAFFTYFTFN